MHRLVIVEDQTAIREMLAEILALDGNYDLVGQCGDGQEGLRMCLELKPDLVILDAKLPGLNGVELLRRLIKRLPSLRVLVFSGHENPVVVREMLEAGAHGFVEKTAGFPSSRRAWPRSRRAAPTSGPRSRACCVPSSPSRESGRSPDLLTEREREILQLVAEGNTTKADRGEARASAPRRSTTTAPTSCASSTSTMSPA